MKKKVLIGVTIIVMLIIFAQSIMPADISRTESDAAYSLLDKITEFLHIANIFTNTTIRKAAHFTEFALYGVLVTCTAIAIRKNLKECIFTVLFVLLSVPVADETIQYSSYGRTPNVSDVLIDFSGCVTGLVIVIAITFIAEKIKNNKNRHLPKKDTGC